MKHTQKLTALPDLAKKIGWFYTLFSTGCLSGYAPVASGTFGTAVAIPLYLLLMYAGRALGIHWVHWLLYALITLGLFVVGVRSADKIESAAEQKDSGIIVIDEIVGYLVTMFLVPQSWSLIIIGFFVFRFFDIFKPYPIRKFDKDPTLKGFGVMIDDVLAGVYGAIIMQIIVFATEYYI